MSAVREIDRSTALEMVSGWLAEYIIGLPLGSEHTLATVLKPCMKKHGYKETEGYRDLKYSKDGGETYLIDDGDLMELKELTIKKLRGKRELNSSMFAHDLDGLPENIPFIILEDNGPVLMRIAINSQRGLGFADVTVYDNGKTDISCFTGIGDMGDDRNETIELSAVMMNKIRSVIDDPIISEPQEDYTKDADFLVYDGNSVEVTLYTRYGEKEFYYSNLGEYLDYLDDCPQTKLISGLLVSVLRSISRKTGKTISLRSI